MSGRRRCHLTPVTRIGRKGSFPDLMGPVRVTQRRFRRVITDVTGALPLLEGAHRNATVDKARNRKPSTQE